MSVDPHPGESQYMALRKLRLKPGMFLRTAPPDDEGTPCEAQFCAAIEGRGLMVVPRGSDGRSREFRAGERRTVSGFTGTYAFEFTTTVIQSFEQPFPYTLLAYPGEVNARRVRSSERIRTTVPAYLRRGGAAPPVAGVIVDLSTEGALVNTALSPGEIHEPVKLSFSLLVDGQPADFVLDAGLCHVGRLDHGQGFRAGLAFRSLGRNERLLLQCYTLAEAQAAVSA